MLRRGGRLAGPFQGETPQHSSRHVRAHSARHGAHLFEVAIPEPSATATRADVVALEMFPSQRGQVILYQLKPRGNAKDVSEGLDRALYAV